MGGAGRQGQRLCGWIQVGSSLTPKRHLTALFCVCEVSVGFTCPASKASNRIAV